MPWFGVSDVQLTVVLLAPSAAEIGLELITPGSLVRILFALAIVPRIEQRLRRIVSPRYAMDRRDLTQQLLRELFLYMLSLSV